MKLKYFQKLILQKETHEFLNVAILSFNLWIYLFLGTFIFLYFLFFSENILLRCLALIYLCWMIVDDRANKGGIGNGWLWFRNIVRFDGAINYFPVDLIKTTDLPPNRNYLFAVFPHGLLCFGVILNFISFGSKFWKYYPGIRPKCLTLWHLFYFPYVRELIFIQGGSAATPETLKTLLRASNDPKDPLNSDGFTSNAAILVPGGVREVLHSHPNKYHILAKIRRGYVKQAIINGSPLVPVFSFGEVDLYDQPENPPGSLIRKWQEFTKNLLGFPLIKLNGVWSFIPKKKPINTVVGGPIEVIQNENPTEEYIEEIHEKFLTSLNEIFEKYKWKYVNDPENCHLIME